MKKLLFSFGFVLLSFQLVHTRPAIWVYSDMSDPRDQRGGGHPQNDPDDICSMAALLLSANRFDIKGIVLGSTNRKGLKDPIPFVEELFVSAYQEDLKGMNAVFGGYPESIPFLRSSITQTYEPICFDENADYEDISGLPTVKALVDLAETEKIYVLCWGPLTEPAIALAHCLQTGKMDAVNNMVFIAHWTMSTIAQGAPERPFNVANCRDDATACAFLHEMAAELQDVHYHELGSIGQGGIVNGSASYHDFEGFNHSRLGQIFVKSKFYHGKPDQSDASTFWILTGSFGVGLDDVPPDGTMPTQREILNRDLFFEHGKSIIENLRMRSDAAANFSKPFSEELISDTFVYVYQFLNGRYYIYLPYEGSYEFVDPSGTIVKTGTLKAGNHQLNLSDLEKGNYDVLVTCGDIEQFFQLEKQD